MQMMSTKTVALDEAAYSALKRAKKPDESFSDVVKRMATPRRPLSDFVGIWKDMPAADFEAFDRWRTQSRSADIERQRKLLPKAR
jgi:predicted CopG family antitoxin